MEHRTKVLLVILVIIVALIVWGPILGGYHRGTSTADVLNGAHCIQWVFNATWCKP